MIRPTGPIQVYYSSTKSPLHAHYYCSRCDVQLFTHRNVVAATSTVPEGCSVVPDSLLGYSSIILLSTRPINWTQSLHSTGKLQFTWVPLSLLKRIQHKFRSTHSQRNLLSCIWLLLTRYDYKSAETEPIMRFSKYLIYEQSRSIRLSLVFMLHNQGLNTTP